MNSMGNLGNMGIMGMGNMGNIGKDTIMVPRIEAFLCSKMTKFA